MSLIFFVGGAVRKLKTCLYLLTALLVLNAPAAYALEPVNFDAQLGLTDSLHLETYLKTYEAAPADLNGDGLKEFILKNKDCKAQTLCEYKVLAYSHSETLTLAEFKAQQIALSDHYTSGVRDILVYNNPLNDYAHTIYAWNAANSKFVEKPSEGPE